MGEYKIKFEKQALKDLEKHKKSGDIATIKKINKIIPELSEHPLVGVGNPEELKYELSGKMPRELNKKDRIIYKVDEKDKIVLVFSALGHYYDK